MNTSHNYSVAQEVMKLMELNSKSFQAEEDGNAELLSGLLTDDFKILRSKENIVHDKNEMVNAVPENAGRDRKVEEVYVKIRGEAAEAAVVVSLVSTKGEGGRE